MTERLEPSPVSRVQHWRWEKHTICKNSDLRDVTSLLWVPLIPLQLYMTDIYACINEIGVNLQWTIITQVKNQTPKNKHVQKKTTKKLEIIYSMQYIYVQSWNGWLCWCWCNIHVHFLFIIIPGHQYIQIHLQILFIWEWLMFRPHVDQITKGAKKKIFYIIKKLNEINKS